MLQRLLRASYLLAFGIIPFALAAPNPSPESPSTFNGTCTFSCPLTDANGQKLVGLPGAIPYDSAYSIFECVYPLAEPTPGRRVHTCSYDKATGRNVLSSSVDDCAQQALPCSSSPDAAGESSNSNTPPRFSYLKYEMPGWVEFNRYTMNLRT